MSEGETSRLDDKTLRRVYNIVTGHTIPDKIDLPAIPNEPRRPQKKDYEKTVSIRISWRIMPEADIPAYFEAVNKAIASLRQLHPSVKDIRFDPAYACVSGEAVIQEGYDGAVAEFEKLVVERDELRRQRAAIIAASQEQARRRAGVSREEMLRVIAEALD